MSSILLSPAGLLWCSHISLFFWDDLAAVGDGSNHNSQFKLQTTKSSLATNTLRSFPAPLGLLRWLVIHEQLQRQPDQKDTKDEEGCNFVNI